LRALETGIAISSTESSRTAAKALVQALIDLGFDSHLSPRVEPPRNGDRIDVFVLPRPKGPQGEAKLKLQAAKKKTGTK
jgi:hypothetical protein